MRKPVRDLSSVAGFGSLADAHRQYKADLAMRAEQAATVHETNEALREYGRPSLGEIERIAQVFARPELFRDVITDEQAREIQGRVRHTYQTPETENPQNLPALPGVFTNALICEQGTFRPKWHLVCHLPTYLQEALRSLGRQTIAAFTKTNLEQIRLTGTKIAPDHEVREIVRWVANNGHHVEQPEKEVMTFAGLLDPRTQTPYEAQTRLYECGGIDFLVVRDPYGHYVYSWPTKDRIGFEYTLIADQGVHSQEIEAEPLRQLIR